MQGQYNYSGQQAQYHHQQYPQQQQPVQGYPQLPRYTSQQSLPPMASPSPLNPAARSQNQGYGQAHHQQYSSAGNTAYSSGNHSKYSTYAGNGGNSGNAQAHPLSNALWAEHSPSSPTLAGDDDDEKKGLQSFPPPSSSSSSGDSRSGNGGANPAHAGFAGKAKRLSGAVADASLVKPEHIGWIDGLRFIVACVALNGTFFAATITNDQSYTPIQRSSPLYIFRSFGLALSFFLVILGRALSAPLWDIPTGRSSPDQIKNASSSPSIAFTRLTRAMLIRPFRFLLPVLVVTALLWGLGGSNATKDCNAAGMQQPYWNLISRFAGYVTIVFDCFSTFDYQTNIAKTYAGNLWTNAWFFQSSYAVYLCHLMLGNLASSRYWIYLILGFFMWTTNNFFCLALIGMVMSDMAAHGHWAKIRKQPWTRALILQVVLIGVALALQFVNPARNALNNAFATINVTGNTDLTICDLIFATCFMIVFETSPICQAVLGNIVMRYLGKLAPGIYLLAPAITYTVVPTLGISLKNSGTSGSGVLGVTWVVCFAVCVVAAIPFHFLVEYPSKIAGNYFGNFVTRWGARDDDAQTAVKGPQKSAPKKLSGPGAK